MKYRRSLLAVMSFALVACGLAAAHARRDVAQLAAQIEGRKQGGEFSTRGEAMSTLDREARAIYQKYGVKPNIYDEAQLMVRFYLADAVDQNRISEEVARRELRWADTVIEHHREQARQAERDRAALRTLTSLSILNALYGPGSAYGRSLRREMPITCTTLGNITTCH